MITLLLAASLVLEHARVENGDGSILERANVVIDGNGTIVSVGADPGPADATRIDATGKWITPGLVETQSTIGIAEVDMVSSTVETRLAGWQLLAPAFSAAHGFNARSVRIAIARTQGVTHAVSAPHGGILAGTGVLASLSSSPAISEPVAMFGDVTGRAAAQAGGSRGALWMQLRQAFEDAIYYRQNKDAFDRNQSRSLSLSPLHLRALWPVIEGRLPLVLEADRASDVAAALAFAREAKVRLVVVGGAEAWRLAKELAEAKVPVILRPSTQGPSSFDTLEARDDLATVLQQAGVRVILSAFGDVRRLRQEAGIAVGQGLTHAQALRAVTFTPAEVFGQQGLGTIRPGNKADLVVWSGDPFELRTHAERIFVDGAEQPSDHRQRRLVDRYRTLPAPGVLTGP